MGVVPGLPFIPFMLVAVTMAAIGQQVAKNQKKEIELLEAAEDVTDMQTEEKIEEFLHPDAFEIEIGYGLIPLVDANQGGNLLNRITTIRKSFALEMGMIVPPIRIRDNIQLNANEYIFKIYGIEVALGEVMMDYFMVVNPDKSLKLEGVEMQEPTFGLPAIWVNDKGKETAEMAGNTVVEAPAVIATHLMETLKTNCYKLLDRQETQQMLDHLKETHAALVEGLVPDLVPLGVIQKVLKNLLKEKLPIRNLVVILETIADYSIHSKDPDILTEYVRTALSETITDYLKQDNNSVIVTTLDPRLEDHIMGIVKSGSGVLQNLGFSPDQVNKLFQDIGEKIEQVASHGALPTILVSPLIRNHFKRFVESVFPNLFVISFSELNLDTELKSVGVIGFPNES